MTLQTLSMEMFLASLLDLSSSFSIWKTIFWNELEMFSLYTGGRLFCAAALTVVVRWQLGTCLVLKAGMFFLHFYGRQEIQYKPLQG